MKRINRSTYPFLILLMIHTIMLMVTFTKKRNRKTLFVLLLSNIGVGYIFEYFVLNLFHGYRYKPRILKNKAIDNVFGAILSQAIFVPFTALFITAFKLGWKVKIGFTLYFVSIERLFLKLKIYKNYWWKTLYTAILMPCFFWLSDQWYKKLKEGEPTILLFSLFNSIMITSANLLYALVIKGKLKFGLGRYHSWREHFMMVPLYTITLSIFATWSIRKESWKSKANILIFVSVLDWILLRLDFVKIKFKRQIYKSIPHILMIVVATFYKKLVYSHKQH